MEKKILQIETGLKEFSLNDAVTVRFNPTDSAFVGKIYTTFSELEKKQEEYQKKIMEGTTDEVIELTKTLDKEMRDTLEDIFGVDVVTPLIGNANVYSMAGGMPIWTNILLAVMDELEVSTEEQRKLNAEKIAFYTKKYQAKDHQRKARK